MPGWNFADVVGGRGRAGPRRAGARCRATAASRGRELRPPGQRRRPGPARRGAWQEQDKVAQYLYNGPEYLESVFATFKAGLAPDQHELPLPRRRARLPLGQRRRRRRRVPRHLRRAHRGHPRPRAPDQARGSGSTTAPGRAPTGRSPTRPRPRPGTPEPVARPVGPRRRPPAPALHRRHHRHAQGRDVAPGRPVPHPRRHGHRPRVRDAEPGPRASSATRCTAPGLDRAARPARSCTAPAASRS